MANVILATHDVLCCPSESPTIEDFAVAVGMTQEEMEGMREVLIALATGEGPAAAETRQLVDSEPIGTDLEYLIGKLVNSHFLE